MAVTIMSWNIENLGSSKLVGYGEETFWAFCRYVASIINKENVSLLGIMEVRENLGMIIGWGITNVLNSTYGKQYGYISSTQFGAGRMEEYLFIYQSPLSLTDVSDEFNDIMGNPVHFPLKSDRPPFMGLFTDGATSIPILLFHARGPVSGKDPRHEGPKYGNCMLARIKDIQPGSAAQAILMGDFNITPSNITADTTTDAYYSFKPLKDINMNWQVHDSGNPLLTSLRPANFVPPDINSIFSYDYDNFYTRPDRGGIGSVDNLLLDLFPTSGHYDTDIDKNFRDYIYCYKQARLGAGIGAVVPYTALQPLFADFRLAVSDHMPIIMDW